jgi:hypothetical protein
MARTPDGTEKLPPMGQARRPAGTRRPGSLCLVIMDNAGPRGAKARRRGKVTRWQKYMATAASSRVAAQQDVAADSAARLSSAGGGKRAAE